MTESVFIPNKKGLKLAATVYKPDGNGPFPGVLFLTGFSQNQQDEHVVTLCQKLSEQGIAAMSFETAGTGRSEGGIEEFLLTNYYNDVDVIYEYFVSLSYIDKERIGIAGHSLGSVVALLYAAKNPTNIKAIAAVMPFIHFSDLHLHVPMHKWQQEDFLLYSRSNGEEVKLPYTFVEDADKAEVLELVRSLTQPKLIIVGEADEIVSPQDTKEIYEHAAEPKELIAIEGIGHLYKKNPEQVKEINKKVVAFFKENL